RRGRRRRRRRGGLGHRGHRRRVRPGTAGLESPLRRGPRQQGGARVTNQAEIGVFGGYGFYSLLDDVREIKVDTPYGPPSDSFFLATVAGRSIAFLPRHGRRHTIPPHLINYRANVWAMRSLGVKAVISPCAAGSLQRHVKPGDFVLCDQFVDRTRNRVDTFYDGPIVTHVSAADIYDPVLRGVAADVIREH